MIGLLWRLIVGSFKSCNHQWDTTHKIPIRDDGESLPTGYRFVLTCKNCGNIKKRDI